MCEASETITKWKPYPKYKDSGFGWVKQIPDHWEIWKLSHAFKRIGSGTTPSTDNIEYYDGIIPWVTTSELRENMIKDTASKLTEEALKHHTTLSLYPIGTLLVAMYGATIGRLGILGVPACTNQACCAFADSDVLDNRFLFYSLLMRKQDIIMMSSGGGQPNINQDKLRSFRIVAPKILEQHTIAAFLDRETAMIDALITKKERLIDLLQEKRAAVISHAVTRGLDPSVPMKDSDVEWLGEVPEHWNILQLRRVVRKFVDYRGATPEKVPDGVPLITAKNIKSGFIDFNLSREFIREEDYENWMVRGMPECGDVLLTTEAPLGESAQIQDTNIALAQRIILLKAHKYFIENDYLKYHFSAASGMAELWSRATGSTAIGIKASHLREVLVTVPPLNEQMVISRHIDRENASIDALIYKIQDGIEKLKEYRIALISAAVTGKIDVRNEVGGVV